MATDRVYQFTNFTDVKPVLDYFDAVIDSIPIMRCYIRDYGDFICQNYSISKLRMEDVPPSGRRI